VPATGLGEFGIPYDRQWLVDDTQGRTLTQRTNPELALVRTAVSNGLLLVNAPGMGELQLPLGHDPAGDKALVDVNLWKRSGTAQSSGPDAAAYFSDYLHRPARVLHMVGPRPVKPECRVDGAVHEVAFADGFPLLVTSLGSLAELNTYLAEHGEDPVPMDRFRPNIVVEGPAYDEDYWREIRIGDLGAHVVRACTRCPVPNIPQDIGVLFRERPVTRALRATRHGIDHIGEKGDFFGQNVVHVYAPKTTIRVGDPVFVLTRDTERNWQPAT